MKVRDVKLSRTYVLANMKDPALNGLAGKVRASRYRITGTNTNATRVFTIRLDVGGEEHEVPASNLDVYDPLTFFTESERDVYVKALAQMQVIATYLASILPSPSVLEKNPDGANSMWVIDHKKSGSSFGIELDVRRSADADDKPVIMPSINVDGILIFGEENFEFEITNTNSKEVRKVVRAQAKQAKKKAQSVLDYLSAVEAA